MVRIVKKDVKPVYTPAQAFMAQRDQEPGSERLREAVKSLLSQGRARTTTVAKVFELIVNENSDRIGTGDIERVLPGFTKDTTPAYNTW